MVAWTNGSPDKDAAKPVIGEAHKQNFLTMLEALDGGVLCLMAATRKSDSAHKVLICAVQNNGDGTFTPVPLAELIDGDPFESYTPPTVG